MSQGDQILFGVVTFIIAAVVAYFLYATRGGQSSEAEQEENRSEESTKKKKKAAPPPPSKKALRAKEKGAAGDGAKALTHPWLAGTLKGHTGGVQDLDFTLNGKYLASCAEDRTAMIWLTKDFLISNHKQIRVNLGLNYAEKIFWSPDSKAFVISDHDSSTLEVYKLGKKPDGSVGNVTQLFTVDNAHGENQIVGISIASSGKFMMSGSRNGIIKLWDLRGNLLSETASEIKQINSVKLSSCGRFIGICGNSSQVAVLSVIYNKSGAFEKLKPAFSLDGHDKEVLSIDFNLDASNIVSVDKAGTWRLFDATGTKPTLRFSGKVETTSGDVLITSISNDSRVSAVAVNTRLEIFSAKSGVHLKTIETYYDDPMSAVKFSIDDTVLVTSSNNDRCIKIFHNVCGYMEKVKDLKDQAKSADISAALKERLVQEAETVATTLKKLSLNLNP